MYLEARLTDIEVEVQNRFVYPLKVLKSKVGGISLGKRILRLQFASTGRLSQNPIVIEDNSPTVVTESALTKVGLLKVAKSEVVILKEPLQSKAQPLVSKVVI